MKAVERVCWVIMMIYVWELNLFIDWLISCDLKPPSLLLPIPPSPNPPPPFSPSSPLLSG